MNIKRKLLARSQRVKGLDIHPTEPWVASSIFSGQVHIWNYQTQVLVKTIEVSEKPVRTVRFIPSQQWIVTGDDLAYIRVYNYNTLERVVSFAAHTDYIRSIAVHPTQPWILSASDDGLIKRWDWSQDWKCVGVYAEHENFVRYVEFNPKDANTFVSASIDGTVKVWGINSERSHYTLAGHSKGVTCAIYYPHTDKPYIASSAEDGEIKIWDYQTKKCVTTIAPLGNRAVNWLAYHPRLPYLVAGDDNGLLRLWHSSTYQPEPQPYNISLGRLWVLAFQPNSSIVAAGYDDGMGVFKIGSERPVASMDASGRVVWAKDTDIFSARIPSRSGAGATSSLIAATTFNQEEAKSDVSPSSAAGSSALSPLHPANADPQDGEFIPLAAKDAITAEFAPSFLKHSPNGRLVATCNGTQFVLYTGLTLKTQMHGPAQEFAWSDAAAGAFATREDGSQIKVYKNLKESHSFKLPYRIQKIYGGHLLAICGAEGVDFFDWNDKIFIARVSDVAPLNIQWSDTGDLVAMVCEESTYVLRYNAGLVAKFLSNPQLISPDGIEGAFELEHELAEGVRSGAYVGSCFLYTNSSNRVAYLVGTESIPIAHTQEPVYVLGYSARDNRVYCMTRDNKLVSYTLLHDTLVFQTAILRGDGDAAREALQRLPASQHTALARFLESQGRVDLALEISTDKVHRFELAVRQGLLSMAADIATELDVEESSEGAAKESELDPESSEAQAKTAAPSGTVLSSASKLRWKLIGDLALTESFDLALARRAYTNAGDVNSLLMLYSSLGHRKGLEELAPMAKALGMHNVAFAAMFLLDDVKGCIDLLCEAGRAPEAACFARVYAPSLISEPLKLWKEQLTQLDAKGTSSKLTAEALADPLKHPELFPEYKGSLLAEEYWNKHYVPNKLPATAYVTYIQKLFERNPAAEIEQGMLGVVSEDLGAAMADPDLASPTGLETATNADADLLRAQQEAERVAREEAEKRAREEAERKAREEAERKAREEAERKAREEAERKAREEAELRAKQELALRSQQTSPASSVPSFASATTSIPATLPTLPTLPGMPSSLPLPQIQRPAVPLQAPSAAIPQTVPAPLASQPIRTSPTSLHPPTSVTVPLPNPALPAVPPQTLGQPARLPTSTLPLPGLPSVGTVPAQGQPGVSPQRSMEDIRSRMAAFDNWDD